MTRLHLGCGLITPPDWVNIDGSWNARLAQYPILQRVLTGLRLLPQSMVDVSWSRDILVHNVKRPLPYVTNSVEAVYASHLLEHLYREEANRLLVECFRVLRPGGILRIVVPDLRASIFEYMGEGTIGNRPSAKAITSADLLQQRLLLRNSKPPSGPLLYKLYSAFNDFHSHKWMYDAESLTKSFQEAGFGDVQNMACHASRIVGIEGIEDPRRVLNGEGICIEGIKPGIDTVSQA